VFVCHLLLVTLMQYGKTPLYMAALSAQKESVEMLLNYGANVDTITKVNNSHDTLTNVHINQCSTS
jgi:ankyrin repeat protein